ncbi:unnamed protein product [Plutella xylostella]|uniref:(diamondback moth) hypothetical protein n=1 Tax=Plutella xylostella TaxID=51655 RepID=A0A8S4G9K3_PLUXY|nr:unnamed protein product [Plutella xylostella]
MAMLQRRLVNLESALNSTRTSYSGDKTTGPQMSAPLSRINQSASSEQHQQPADSVLPTDTQLHQLPSACPPDEIQPPTTTCNNEPAVATSSVLLSDAQLPPACTLHVNEPATTVCNDEPAVPTSSPSPCDRPEIAMSSTPSLLREAPYETIGTDDVFRYKYYITEINGENLTQVVNVLSNKLGVQLDPRDVDDVRRVGARGGGGGGGGAGAGAMERPRPVMLTFTRRAPRDQLLRAAKARRGITTEMLEVPGNCRRVFVNEHLTKENRVLFSKARALGAELKFKFVWTSNCNIFMRRSETSSVLRITSESILDKLAK